MSGERADMFPREFTLRDVFEYPFPTELTAAFRGDSVAWVYNQAGCRNLWVAGVGELNASAARQLTSYRGDDGMTMGQLQWSALDNAVLYVRGATLSDAVPPVVLGAIPRSGAPEIWLVPKDGGHPRRLATGHSPTASPSSGQVAFVHRGQIWCMAADEEASLLVSDRGACGELSWSPDGTSLAFVSDRGTHSLVGVYDTTKREVRWMCPSVDRDTCPTWSPNGQEIAFVRLMDDVAPTYAARPSGTPWSLWRAEQHSGVGRCIWRARSGMGSVFMRLSSGIQLHWTGAGSLIFPWEGSGWLHLHSLVLGEEEARDLTPGSFEVSAMAPTSQTYELICACNKDDVTGSRLWRVDLSAGCMTALTSQRVYAGWPAVTGNGTVVALQSDARHPLAPVWIGSVEDCHALASGTAQRQLPFEALPEPRHAMFRSPDGQEIHAQLFLPRESRQAAARPAIVHFHGGPARQLFAAWHPIECYHLQYGLNQYFAQRGYVVLSVNYRGGTGYGAEFREPTGLGAGGASEYLDALGAAHYLRARSDVDPARIGVYGASYGGLMAALALARASDYYAAGAVWGGVFDWRPAFSAAGPEAMASAYRSSPVASIETWTSPTLFVHADDDRVVPFSQTIDMVRALRQRANADIECLVLPDEQHDFMRSESWARAFSATSDFFDRRLMTTASGSRT